MRIDATTQVIAEAGRALGTFMDCFFKFCGKIYFFIKSTLFALIATGIWLGVTIAVALPGKWSSLNIEDLSKAFLFDNHFLYFFILILADLLISITILNDLSLKKRITSRVGVGVVILGMIATLVVAVMKGGGPDTDVLNSHHFGVFISLMLLFGAIRFVMYWVENSLGNRSNRSDVSDAANKKGVAAVKPKFTAIPVDSIKPSGITE